MAKAKLPLPVQVAKQNSADQDKKTAGTKPAERADVDKEGRREPADKKKEEEQVKFWLGRIALAKEENRDWHEVQLKRLRAYVLGTVHDDGAKGLVRTNLIFSTIATNCPHIYAKDPEIEVSLTDAVPRTSYGVYKDFARSLQSVLDSLFTRGAKLKLRAKSAVRSTMTTAVGWAKVIYQCDVREDPLTASRMNDTQDNIQRVLTLIEQINRGEAEGDTGDLAAKKMELEEQMQALSDHREVSTVHGIVIDRVLTEDMLLLDLTIKDFDYYVEADAMAHGLWVTADRYQDLFGYKVPTGATTFDRPEAKPEERTSQSAVKPGANKPPTYYRVWEIWHKTANTVLTVAEGATTWARVPYQPKNVGARWYPFFGLAFNPVDGRWRPMSDVELLTELQDEYNTTRTNFAEARKSAIPVMIVRTGGDLTPDDIENIKNRKINQIIAVEGTPGTALSNEIVFLPAAEINPTVYDTSPIRADFELVSGTADAARGNITKAKTATEAEILQQGLMSRGDERRDVMEDWVGEMAQYSAEILLDVLTRPQVARLVGTEAAQKWPTLSRDRIFEMVQLRIKAGSAGRPNQQKEREQWIALLPEIQKTIEQVFTLQLNGDVRLARTSIELLRETLERFDEYIDLDRFIPPEMQDGDGQDAQSQMMAEMLKLKQQIQALTDENTKIQDELQKTQGEVDSAKRGEQVKLFQAQEDAKMAEEQARRADALKAEEARYRNEELRRKNTAETLSQTRQLNFQKQLEELKIASQERIEKYKIDAQAKLQAEQAIRDAALQAETLKSGEKVAADKNKSAQSIAADKNKAATGMAGDKNKTTVATAKMGADTTVKTTKMGLDAAAAVQVDEAQQVATEGQVLGKLADAIDKLAEVVGADSVPVRGANGLIERVKKVPKAKPKAKK